jgi:hypothetical protein
MAVFRNIRETVFLPFVFLEEGIPGPNKVCPTFTLSTLKFCEISLIYFHSVQ